MHARVKDIMTTRVVAVRSDASYREMIAALRAHRVSGLPVVDAKRPEQPRMCLPVGTKVPSSYLLRPLPDPMKQK